MYKVYLDIYNIMELREIVIGESGMGKYKKCPRCELNYILQEDDLCRVCKAQLGIGDMRLLEDDDEENVDRCPVCKLNALEYGEDMCSSCKKNQDKLLFVKEEDEDASESWRTFIDDEPPVADDDIEIPLSEIAEEEEWSEEAEEEEEFIDNSDDDFEYVDPTDDDYDDDYEDDDDDDDF